MCIKELRILMVVMAMIISCYMGSEGIYYAEQGQLGIMSFYDIMVLWWLSVVWQWRKLRIWGQDD